MSPQLLLFSGQANSVNFWFESIDFFSLGGTNEESFKSNKIRTEKMFEFVRFKALQRTLVQHAEVVINVVHCFSCSYTELSGSVRPIRSSSSSSNVYTVLGGSVSATTGKKTLTNIYKHFKLSIGLVPWFGPQTMILFIIPLIRTKS